MGLLTIQWAPLELVRNGEYQAAIAELGSRWPGLGEIPRREELPDKEYALLLLVCGMLSVKLAAVEQRSVQETAKDMLSKSARLLAGEPEECAAKLYLAATYNETGEYEEALAVAEAVLSMEADSEVEFCALLVKAIAVRRLGRIDEAWSVLEIARPLAGAVLPLAKGKFYLERGNAQQALGNLEQAILEYDEASQCFVSCENARYAATVSNNVATVYMRQGQLHLALQSARHAANLFHHLKDRAFEAKALDQIATIFLAENKPVEAETAARRAVELLDSGTNAAWLAEALITHGRALLQMGTEQAQSQIKRAAEICATIGDHQQVGEAEDLLVYAFKTARGARDRLNEHLKRIEPKMIQRALEFHGNRIPPAAKSLGMTRQALEDKASRISGITPTKRRRGKTIIRN